MIKIVKSAKEDRHRNVNLQNERKKRCWAKVAEMDKSRIKATIIRVKSCSFVLYVPIFQRNPYILKGISYLCCLNPTSLRFIQRRC
jgi:hypothetical protein